MNFSKENYFVSLLTETLVEMQDLILNSPLSEISLKPQLAQVWPASQPLSHGTDQVLN